MTNKELRQVVYDLKAVLVVACMGGCRDEEKYSSLRSQVREQAVLQNTIPACVLACETLEDICDYVEAESTNDRDLRVFFQREFAPMFEVLWRDPRSPAVLGMNTFTQRLTWASVTQSWANATARQTTDPEGAITLARTMLESVCKCVLDEHGLSYDDTTDMPKLGAQACRMLRLSPADYSEDIFKRILGACMTVVEGIAALRNRHGDAHGRGVRVLRPAVRHAELAVNLAGSTATFLISTLEARRQEIAATKLQLLAG
jgi:hypothetical protein